MSYKHIFSHYLVIIAAVCTLSSCRHTTLEDRAEQEARDFTERYCPTPVKDMQRTDSVTFDRATHTFNYYFQISGAADNPETIKKMKPMLRSALVEDLVGNTGSKAFKDHGYSFRYVFVSAKTHEIIFEEILTKKDYQ